MVDLAFEPSYIDGLFILVLIKYPGCEFQVVLKLLAVLAKIVQQTKQFAQTRQPNLSGIVASNARNAMQMLVQWLTIAILPHMRDVVHFLSHTSIIPIPYVGTLSRHRLTRCACIQRGRRNRGDYNPRLPAVPPLHP